MKIQSSLQSEFSLAQECLNNNLILNKQKSGSMLYGTRYNLNHSSAELAIHFADECPLNKVDAFKYLGLWIGSEFLLRPFRTFSFNRNKTYCFLLYLPSFLVYM